MRWNQPVDPRSRRAFLAAMVGVLGAGVCAALAVPVPLVAPSTDWMIPGARAAGDDEIIVWCSGYGLPRTIDEVAAVRTWAQRHDWRTIRP